MGTYEQAGGERAPYNAFTLYDDFFNYCRCGEIDLSKSDFIEHVKEYH